jgi:hypothetical protein
LAGNYRQKILHKSLDVLPVGLRGEGGELTESAGGPAWQSCRVDGGVRVAGAWLGIRSERNLGETGKLKAEIRRV